MFTSEKMVKFLREKYLPGTRIRLVSMEDPYAPVAPGTEGTLVCVDDAGQFQMKWDNGRTLALIPGEDSFTVLPPERSVLKLYMPLTAELYEPDEWGDMPEEAERLTGGELASYEDKIRSALFKNRMQEEQVRGIMYWYRKPDSVNDKAHSVSNAEGDRIDSVQDDERNFSGRDDGALHSEGCRLQGEYTNRQGIVTRAHSGVGNRCRR